MRLLMALLSALGVLAGDPSDSWLSYAVYSQGPSSRITMLNASWVVMSEPTQKSGSNAPGWWFGIQTADGNGALIQPIMAWADGALQYTIFNGVYDWNTQSWHQSKSSPVKPGNHISASINYIPSSNSYEMNIACKESGWSVKTPWKVQGSQIEATAYFVVEHQPNSCRAYPPEGKMSFTNIYMEVDGKPVTPSWTAKDQKPACSSSAVIVSSSEIQFTWKASDEEQSVPSHSRFHDRDVSKE